jgi:hypothetical protein
VALVWACWAGRVLVTLGVCQHLDGPVIGGSLSGVGDCFWLRLVDSEGCCAFPGREPKGNSSKLLMSLNYPHLWVGSCGAHLLGQACDCLLARRTTKLTVDRTGTSVPAST